MGATDLLLLLFTRPSDFRTLTQFWFYHEIKRDITAKSEHATSGWDRPTMQRCWKFLDKTSRSFSAVIKELDGELARVICLFYLVLRGLDTIEDDMALPDHIKQPLLRSFHEKVVTPGWNFNGNGSREKDRQLLIEFDCVVAELCMLSANYRDVVVDICRKMAVGMADYAHRAHETGSTGVDTLMDFDLYCHYVAGLVGEGLSRLFAASRKEQPWLGNQLALANAMGLMLQKVNILRDFREDGDEGRVFWPREVWSSYGFQEARELWQPENAQRALWALSHMTLDSFRHAIDVLDYLSLIRNQSVFNFCAIPQTMAMATLAVCFMNPQVFQRNVKISKAEAAGLIMRSTNPREVAYIFRHYARVIHSKCVPADPNFLRVSIACGKIEQWCEHHYPSFVQLSSLSSTTYYNKSDIRARVALREDERTAQIARRKRLNGGAAGAVVAAAGQRNEQEKMPIKEFMFIMAGVGGSIFVVGAISVWIALRFST